VLNASLQTIVPCAALIALGAAVHGSVTQRWTAFTPDPARAERGHALAVRFADCTAEVIDHDLPVKERSTATSRRYSSAEHGFTAATSLISGLPGAVATHTPDVCYSGNGYRCLRGPLKETLDLPGGGTAQYWVADFERTRSTGVDRQRVRWAWTTDGIWTATDRPRFAYARESELFKLYVVTEIPDGGGADPTAVRSFAAAAFAQYASAVAR
jgi:hypothetical protein